MVSLGETTPLERLATQTNIQCLAVLPRRKSRTAPEQLTQQKISDFEPGSSVEVRPRTRKVTGNNLLSRFAQTREPALWVGGYAVVVSDVGGPVRRSPSLRSESQGRARRRRPSLRRRAHGAVATGCPPETRACARLLISATVAASSPERLTAKPLPADVTLAFTPLGMSGQ